MVVEELVEPVLPMKPVMLVFVKKISVFLAAQENNVAPMVAEELVEPVLRMKAVTLVFAKEMPVSLVVL
jgi:hypothetical protein